MRFGRIDATEAQITMMLIMVFTAIVGTGFWGTKVSGIIIHQTSVHANNPNKMCV